MTELLERLAAANPVSEIEQPSIAEVWRKVAELDAQPRSHRGAHRLSLPRSAGRASLALAATVVPILVVLAVAIPLHGIRHSSPGPASPATGRSVPALDRAAQRVAALALAGRAGSVVALDPRTGAIKVLYTNTNAGSPLSGDAAARVQYPPEAIFDIVTAAAALDTGRYTTTSRITGPSPFTVSGQPLSNGANQSFGPITLTQALSLSVNTVFAKVGENVGRATMTKYMRRFGFYSSPQLAPGSAPLPAAGAHLGNTLVLPTNHDIDLGRLAAGQGSLVGTPLQMAMIAAAVADGGKLMAPHLGTTAPRLSDRVMKPSTAQALAQMMRAVVTHGTGTRADLARVPIAGKTGTAQGLNLTDPWFIGFAPVNDPKIVVAVVLSDVKAGYGGTVAAPIAARVIQRLLDTRHP